MEDFSTENATTDQLVTLINGLCNKETLLDLIRFFTVYERYKSIDKQGLTSVKLIKKIGAYHQYYTVNKAIALTVKVSSSKGKDHGKSCVI